MARKLKTDLVIPAGSDIDDLISGGPGAAPEPAGPAMVEVTLGGKKYLVPAAAAADLQAQYTAQEAELGRVRGELDSARRAPPAAATTPTASPATPAASTSDDLDTEFFTSPSQAIGKVTRTLRDEIKREMRQEYTLEQARAKWWADFYKAHDHLIGSEVLVETIMQRNFAELEKLPVDQQAGALAAKVETELERIIKARTERRPPSNVDNGRPVEGVSRPAPAAPPSASSAAPQRPTSIADITKAARERRLNARTGRQHQQSA